VVFMPVLVHTFLLLKPNQYARHRTILGAMSGFHIHFSKPMGIRTFSQEIASSIHHPKTNTMTEPNLELSIENGSLMATVTLPNGPFDNINDNEGAPAGEPLDPAEDYHHSIHVNIDPALGDPFGQPTTHVIELPYVDTTEQEFVTVYLYDDFTGSVKRKKRSAVRLAHGAGL